MRSRLPVVVFGLAVAALAVVAVSVASVASDGESPPSTVAASATQPTQAGTSSDDDPGDISGPCDEAEHAGTPRCAGATPAPADRAPASRTPADDAPAATAPAPARSGNRVVDAQGAGTVTYTVGDRVLSLVEAAPAAGWSVEVEQAAGDEIEVDFRSGTRRVQLDVEFEDGQVRERVRVRDDADDSELRFENGILVRQEFGDDLDDDDLLDDHDDRDDDRDDRDDNSGPGSSSSGRDDDHDDDDRSDDDGDDD